jgi:MFS family permease
MKTHSLRALDALNFFLADVQTGIGPFVAIYLATRHWNDQSVGLALTVASLAGVLMQTPAGALVDHARAKRRLIAIGVVLLVVGALALGAWPILAVVVAAHVMLGGVGTIFGPAVNAITLGLVGPTRLDRRIGRNQAFNSAGNVVAAVSMGLITYYLSARAIFFAVPLFAIPTFIALGSIAPGEIDYEQARGARADIQPGRVSRLSSLFRDRRLLAFIGCVTLFHFANAAMLPELGELLARGRGRSSGLFMAACVITTQVVITLLAPWVGRKAAVWGRKPLLLIGFGVLPVRGFLYTLTTVPALLIAIQVLDGIANAIFVVVSVLVIADLTRGTGRFSLAQGALATAVGVGASLSTLGAGFVVYHYGYDTGFLSLAGVAVAAFIVLWVALPETGQPSLTSAAAEASQATVVVG